MDSTPIFNIPYPEGGDDIDSAQIKALAEAVESAIGTYQTPQQHVMNLAGNYEANPNAPLTFYRMGRLIVCNGEIYRTSGTSETVGTLPVTFRPVMDRVRIVTIRSSTPDSGSRLPALFTISQNGSVTLSGAVTSGTTPGYNLNVSYLGSA